MDINKAILMGHVGMDPTFHQTRAGLQMAKFSVATSRKWTDKETQEKREDTSWHNIVIFNKYLVKLTEQFVQKGTKVYLEGESKTRKYDKDGIERYITEIIIPQVKGELIIIARGKGWTETRPGSSEQPPAAMHTRATDEGYDDDIPF